MREHFGRFTGGAKRSETVVYFIPVLLIGFLPWVLLRGTHRPLLRPFSLERLRERSDTAFFLVWAATVFLFFSLSRSKLIPYVLPAFPPLVGADRPRHPVVRQPSHRQGAGRRRAGPPWSFSA